MQDIDCSVLALDGPAHFARAIFGASRDFGPFNAVVTHSMAGAAVLLAVADGRKAERTAIIALPIGYQKWLKDSQRQ